MVLVWFWCGFGVLLVWFGMVLYGLVWFGMVWYGFVGIVWYGGGGVR